jgi:hypothetical protein
LTIGESSAGPELVGGLQERHGRRQPLLRGGAQGVLDLLFQDLLFGEVQAVASLGYGTALHLQILSLPPRDVREPRRGSGM